MGITPASAGAKEFTCDLCSAVLRDTSTTWDIYDEAVIHLVRRHGMKKEEAVVKAMQMGLE